MEILRLAPFPLTYTNTDLSPNTDYVVCILDSHAVDLVEIPVTSDGGGEISTPLPSYFSRYDDEYLIEIYESLGENEDGSSIRGDFVFTDNLSIVRPYVNPSDYAETEDELEQAVMYEAIARSIIDSITGGFSFTREVYETTGMGNDYLPIPYRLNKIVKIYENDYVIYDTEPEDPSTWQNLRDYYVTPDKSAITVYLPEPYAGYNRMQSRPVVPPMPASDSFTLYNTNDSPNIIQNITGSPMFPSGWDYTVVVDAGWAVIPQDIKRATALLINDMKCNNAPYVNAYISGYKSDQFNIKLDAKAFEGTGNRVVDKILSNYGHDFNRIGVI